MATKAKKRSNRIAIGIDVSLSTVSMAGLGMDRVRGEVGPEFHSLRWTKETDYFKRMIEACKAYNGVLDILAKLKVTPELSEIWIAVEEPWPFGIVKRAESPWLKQQAQISGALLAGLLRYGFVNVFEINNHSWRSLVAYDLGITTHHTKWGKGAEGKMRAKEWAHKEFDIPEMPDIIQHSKLGQIERPENSKARAVQCHDCYDALACAEYIWRNPNG